jgi:hypothetical protein
MLTLEDSATYQAEEGVDEAPRLLYSAMTALVPRSSVCLQNWGAEGRFYGSLTLPQRAILKAHGQVVYSQLSSQAKTLLETMVFRKHRSFHVDWPTTRRGGSKSGIWMGTMAPESLPNGILNDVPISMNVRSELSLLTAPKGGEYSGLMNVELRAMAMSQLAATIPQIKNYDPLHGGHADEVLPGRQVSYTVRVQFTADTSGSMTLFSPEFDLRANMVSLGQLPPTYRAALDKEMAEVKRQFGGDPARGGTSAPPPH